MREGEYRVAKPEEEVVEIMKRQGIDLVATLPCDRIKNLLPLVSERFHEIKLTREENGLGICAGAYLAGARPMMLIQSTGLGNMINALESLNVACEIPLPLLASWRGVYGEGIEAQVPLGTRLPGILRGAALAHSLIEEADQLPLLEGAIQDAFGNKRPHIALVSPKVWEGSTCRTWQAEAMPERREMGEGPSSESENESGSASMLRNDAIRAIAAELGEEIAVANLGVPCKELYACGDRDLNFYMFGSMGLASSIALGLALRTERTVVTLDGDGSLLMNPNALLEIARTAPKNLIVVCLDNGAYGSTGSQASAALRHVDMQALARASGIRRSYKVCTKAGLVEAFRKARSLRQLSFIHVILKAGNTQAANIPLSPAQVAARFRHAVMEAEGPARS